MRQAPNALKFALAVLDLLISPVMLLLLWFPYRRRR